MELKFSINQSIAHLLHTGDCVVLPSFGGFVARRKPAHYDAETHKIYPPSKQVLFNKHLQDDDGLLTHFVAYQNQIDYSEARELITRYIAELKSKLFAREAVIVSGVGTLLLDSSFTIRFVQNTKSNFLPSSFGLQPIDVLEIQRSAVLQKPDTLVELPIQPVRLVPEKPVVWMLKKAAQIVPIVAGLVFAGLLTLQSNDSGQLRISEMSFISKGAEPLSFGLAPQSPTFSQFTKNRKVPSEKNLESTQVYLIASAFTSISRAEKEVNQLRDKGFDALILKRSKSGLIKVAYGIYASVEEAESELRQIRKGLNEDAYLLIQ
jgi:nucleoid DNA-binding protein